MLVFFSGTSAAFVVCRTLAVTFCMQLILPMAILDVNLGDRKK